MLILHLAVMDRDVPRGYRVYPISEQSEALWRSARRHANCRPDATWPPDWYFNPDRAVAERPSNRSGRDNPQVKRLRTEEGPSTSKSKNEISSSSLDARRSATAQAVLSLPSIRRVSKKDGVKSEPSAASTSAARAPSEPRVLLEPLTATARSSAAVPESEVSVSAPTSVSETPTSVSTTPASASATPASERATPAASTSAVADPDSDRSDPSLINVVDSSEPTAESSMVLNAVNQTSDFVRILSAPSGSTSMNPASPSVSARGMTEFSWMAACLLQASQTRGPSSDEVNDRCGMLLARWLRNFPEAPCSSCPLSDVPCGDCVDRNLRRMMIRAIPSDPRLAGHRSTGGDLAIEMLHRIPELYPVPSTAPCRWCLVVAGPCRSCFGAFMRGPGSKVFPPPESPVQIIDQSQTSASSASSSASPSRAASPTRSQPSSVMGIDFPCSSLDLSELAQGTVFEIRAISPTDLLNGQSLFGQEGNRINSGSSTPVLDEKQD